MATGDVANSKIRTPDDLPSAEREALIERARYEAFRETGANARAVRHSVFAVLVIFAIAIGISTWASPMLQDSLLATALLAGAVGGCSAGLATYWISRGRAKIINAKIQEILEREAKDDSLSTGGSE